MELRPYLRSAGTGTKWQRDKKEKGNAAPKQPQSLRQTTNTAASVGQESSAPTEGDEDKISQDVRDYAAKLQEAEEGMAAKSAEFRERGSEVYLPVMDAAMRDAVEAEETVAAD